MTLLFSPTAVAIVLTNSDEDGDGFPVLWGVFSGVCLLLMVCMTPARRTIGLVLVSPALVLPFVTAFVVAGAYAGSGQGLFIALFICAILAGGVAIVVPFLVATAPERIRLYLLESVGLFSIGIAVSYQLLVPLIRAF